MYQNISILSYIAKGREEFYGWNELIDFAIRKPEISITIAGTDGKNLDFPQNVTCLGWVDEKKFTSLMKENAIFVRLTEHDGKSISVAQALAHGCEVVWTYDFDYCHTIPKESNALENKLNELVQLISERKKVPNQENIQFAENHLLRQPVMKKYLNILNSVLK